MQYIRKLEVSSATGYLRRSTFYHLSLDTLQEVIGLLPSLQSIRLRGLKVVCPRHFSLPDTTTAERTFYQVDISNCDFESDVSVTFPSLLQILCPETVHVYRVACPLNAPVEDVLHCPPTHQPMTSVILHHDGVHPEMLQTLNTIMPGNTFVNLTLLVKNDFDADLMVRFGAVISKHASSLRKLELIPGDWRGLRCKSLKHIRSHLH